MERSAIRVLPSARFPDFAALHPGYASRMKPCYTFHNSTESVPMSHVTYKIVQHEGGWAYTVDGAFSETFPSHAGALAAAKNARRRAARAGADGSHRIRNA